MSLSKPAYGISDATLAKVRGFFTTKDYPAAYQAIADDLKTQAIHGIHIDQNTLTWYTDAAKINDANDTSYIHYFVRDYASEYAQLTIGKTIDDAQFQKISDELAADVLRDISRNGKVDDFNVVGQQDTRNAVEGFKALDMPVGPYAWPVYADSVSAPWLRSVE